MCYVIEFHLIFRKLLWGTGIRGLTRDSDTTFKVKGQGHEAALLTAALMCYIIEFHLIFHKLLLLP